MNETEAERRPMTGCQCKRCHAQLWNVVWRIAGIHYEATICEECDGLGSPEHESRT